MKRLISVSDNKTLHLHQCILPLITKYLTPSQVLEELAEALDKRVLYLVNEMSVTGRFDLLTSDNYENYLIASGVSHTKCTTATAANPTIEISEVDGVYTLTTHSVFKSTTVTFNLGEEFEEETIDGRKSSTTVTVDGNKMIQHQKLFPDEAIIIREFTDNGMTATFTCDKVVATRTYKRVR